jgi:hypothetical protein
MRQPHPADDRRSPPPGRELEPWRRCLPPARRLHGPRDGRHRRRAGPDAHCFLHAVGAVPWRRMAGWPTQLVFGGRSGHGAGLRRLWPSSPSARGHGGRGRGSPPGTFTPTEPTPITTPTPTSSPTPSPTPSVEPRARRLDRPSPPSLRGDRVQPDRSPGTRRNPGREPHPRPTETRTERHAGPTGTPSLRDPAATTAATPAGLEVTPARLRPRPAAGSLAR